MLTEKSHLLSEWQNEQTSNKNKEKEPIQLVLVKIFDHLQNLKKT